MFGASTWAKIALVVVSLGGAASGGTYLMKNNPFNLLGESSKTLDSNIFGGYIISVGNKDSNICSVISEGIEVKREDKELCEKKIMSISGNNERNRKNFRLWLKTWNSDDVKTILSFLGVSSKENEWFSKKDSTELTYKYETWGCKLDEKNTQDPREVEVSCFSNKDKKLSETSWKTL
ncbi:hypothetical protein [Mycoplasma suis]|uniref:Uncharacterized protein n=2 Tax=Mycoplasma suis TaxID=57372 RepID=F0QQ73_MYCSL|nr:hypothetical protein [Mycoplasma suis]ADX97643.1 hypothetical protein MSU_0099 [Mycoplasma suis str. Illinois]CBZ40179.1 hypothetical protein MSUIS_00860 [Mycoplasma suis KI3806]